MPLPDLTVISDPFAEQQATTMDLLPLYREYINERLQAHGRERPLRVLVSSNSLACGGTEHQILRLMPHLILMGLDVEHIYYGAPHVLREKFREKHLCSHFLDRDDLGQLHFWKKAVSMLHAKQYDVVHAFGATANFYIRGAAVFARTPVVIAGWRNRVMDKRLRWKIPISLLNLVTDAWVINAPTNIEALSGLLCMQNLRIYVVPNAIDFHDQDYSHPLPLPTELEAWINGRLLIGAIGRVAGQKNFDMFFEVAKQIALKRDDVCFCLIGSPAGDPPTVALEKHLRSRIKKEDLDGFIRMPGRLDDVAGFLPNLTGMLCTSNYEGCPNAVIEGLRAGLPVVMTDCCDTQSLIEHDRSGYVVPLNDIDAMALRITEILDDAGKRRQFGKRARLLAEKNFTAEKSAWALALIYLKEWERTQKVK